MSLSEYHLYFIDRQNHIEARHDFRAEGDAEARIIAALLCDACSDQCHDYELWNHSRVIISTREGVGTSRTVPAFDEISEERQRIVVENEERLQRSQWRLSESQKLLEAIETLRKDVSGVDRDG